ncbi:MAG: hypothetical protein ACFFBV_16485, partial [Promethearchaeota archaeon]
AKDATLDSSSGINDEVALVYADNSTIPEIAFDLYSMDANGFTLDWAQGGDHGTAVIYLALKGIDIDRGILDQRTGTTGTQTVSGLTFEPTAILFDGGDKNWTDALDPPPWVSPEYAGFEQPAEAIVGVADSTSQAGIWIGSASPRSSDSALSTSDVILSYTAGSPTLNAKAQLSSINSDGFTLNWTNVDSAARKIGWIALGPAAVANSAPDDPTINDHNDGSTTSDNTPTLGFTQSDPDDPEQVKYRIQIDATDNTFGNLVVDYTSDFMAEGATSFTVGQAAGSGSYTVGSESQTLADGDYFWRVMTTDDESAASGWTQATTGSSVAFTVDTNQTPDDPTINDHNDGSTTSDNTPTLGFT